MWRRDCTRCYSSWRLTDSRRIDIEPLATINYALLNVNGDSSDWNSLKISVSQGEALRVSAGHCTLCPSSSGSMPQHTTALFTKWMLLDSNRSRVRILFQNRLDCSIVGKHREKKEKNQHQQHGLNRGLVRADSNCRVVHPRQ